MDEFKSESEDELKPDTSDRPTTRSRKSSLSHGTPVSRQHMMMGIGIFVLLLFVIGIGSALTSPDESGNGSSKPVTGLAAGNSAQADGHDGKSIDLSASGEPSSSAPSASQSLNIPPVSPTPTQAEPVAVPASQQRVEIPGDLNNSLSPSSGAVTENTDSGLPTAQATVNSRLQGAASTVARTTGNTKTTTTTTKTTTRVTQQTAAVPHNKPLPADTITEAHKARPAVSAPSEKMPSVSSHVASGAPAGNYTLQLSSASRADTLDAWAKKQKIGGYHVYQTTRNNQPWFVLVTGSYATTTDAKDAILALPAEVRAKNPWVKPVSQVKKEATR